MLQKTRQNKLKRKKEKLSLEEPGRGLNGPGKVAKNGDHILELQLLVNATGTDLFLEVIDEIGIRIGLLRFPAVFLCVFHELSIWEI